MLPSIYEVVVEDDDDGDDHDNDDDDDDDDYKVAILFQLANHVNGLLWPVNV